MERVLGRNITFKNEKKDIKELMEDIVLRFNKIDQKT